MKRTIDPGKERRSINFIDNICYSHVTDLEALFIIRNISILISVNLLYPVW